MPQNGCGQFWLPWRPSRNETDQHSPSEIIISTAGTPKASGKHSHVSKQFTYPEKKKKSCSILNAHSLIAAPPKPHPPLRTGVSSVDMTLPALMEK